MSSLNSCIHLDPSGYGILDFALPIGAMITAVVVRYSDEDTVVLGQMQFELRATSSVTTSDGIFSNQLTSSGPATTSAALTLINPRPAVSRSALYFIWINPIGMNQYFCGAEVTYTL